MLWSSEKTYAEEPFDLERDLEAAIVEVSTSLFGESRIYLDVKKKIGQKGKTRNIPDAYLLDLSSKKDPTLYVVENELAKHDPLKHIAVQVLEFSLSFESSPQTVKSIVKEALVENRVVNQCQTFAEENGFDNVDYLLEQMIHRDDAFNAMVIIDEIPDELERVLLGRFRFPVEVLSLRRFVDDVGNRIYEFEPFLADLNALTVTGATATDKARKVTIDPSDVDTIVVPAREEGFQDVFLGEDCWRAIRIHSSMIPRIKYIAAYQVAPVSAVTHIAKVHKIEQWKDTNKYVLYFEEPAAPIGPIDLVPKGKVKAPQSSRYTSLDRLHEAKTLDDVF